ncbi:MAG: Protease subunit of ATP-dependent protease, partial [Elusimicrobia bacterium]
PATPAASPALPGAPATPAKPEERAVLEKLTTENQMVREEVTKRLKDLVTEKEELRIKAEVQAERQKAELSKLEAEYQRLALENRLNEEKNKKSLDDLSAVQRRLSAENQLDEEKHKKELANIRQTREKLQQENDILREKLRGEEMKSNSEKLALDLEGQRMASEGAKLRLERDKLEEKVTRLRIDLEERTKKEDWRSQANRDPQVAKEPFKDGVLTISDRRIPLNGAIYRGVSDFINERIDYWNNVSEDPIFLVIDSCPGGSVQEGYRILKAMQASRAPIHVVVKSFAASMCATITTLAAKSYVYPNAIILHHQMSLGVWGNMTQTKEQLELAREWWRRLADPVAKKMGTSLEGYVKRMYEKNSDGDWEEFGDEAVKVKWATNVVQEIRETGIIKKPEVEKKSALSSPFSLEEKLNEKGERYVSLPRLDPFDLYWIYNPDKYYR